MLVLTFRKTFVLLVQVATYLALIMARVRLYVLQEVYTIRTPTNVKSVAQIALNVNHQMTFARHALISV